MCSIYELETLNHYQGPKAEAHSSQNANITHIFNPFLTTKELLLCQPSITRMGGGGRGAAHECQGSGAHDGSCYLVNGRLFDQQRSIRGQQAMSRHHKDLIGASLLQGLCRSEEAVNIVDDVVLSNHRASGRQVNMCAKAGLRSQETGRVQFYSTESAAASNMPRQQGHAANPRCRDPTTFLAALSRRGPSAQCLSSLGGPSATPEAPWGLPLGAIPWCAQDCALTEMRVSRNVHRRVLGF